MSVIDKAAPVDQAKKTYHPVHHEIVVTLQDAVPSGNPKLKPELKKEVVPHIPKVMHVEDTVHYKSDDGKGHNVGVVTIEFQSGSPYLNPNGSEIKTVTSNDPPLELKVRGNFIGRCSIETPDGKKYGWGSEYGSYTARGKTAGNNATDDDPAGGNHDVR